MVKKKHTGKSRNNDIEKGLSQIDLIKRERIGASIGILAYMFFILSSNKAIEITKLRMQGINPPPVPPTAGQLSVIGAVLSLSTSAIFAPIAVTRLRQLESGIRSGTETGPLYPNLNITAGALIGLIGSILLTVGAIERNQIARITII